MLEKPVTFNSERQQIVGIWHQPDGRGPFPTVLFLHGFTGNKAESHRLFVQQARALAQAGIAGLRFDFRGSGDSAGEFSEMTVAGERADARAAMRWLKRKAAVDARRIGILGMSMGGMIAAFTVAEHPEIRAAAFWNPVAFPAALRDRRRTPESDAQLREYGVANNAGYAVGAAFLAELDGLDPVSALAPTRTPVLIVGGTGDEAVPITEGRAYTNAIRARKGVCVMHEIEGADHTFTAFPWQTECYAVTLAWFREHLCGR
jgi:dipeptidyl aminopeptidase/acylaminoacyl peptidase